MNFLEGSAVYQGHSAVWLKADLSFVGFGWSVGGFALAGLLWLAAILWRRPICKTAYHQVAIQFERDGKTVNFGKREWICFCHFGAAAHFLHA